MIEPSPPPMPDLVWREITREDLSLLVDLEAKSHAVDGGLTFLKGSAILSKSYFPETPGASIGAFTEDGSLAASTSVHWVSEEDPSNVRIVGQVRPAWRNKGVGAYMMNWSCVQAQSLCKVTSESHCLLQIITESLTEAARHLYIQNGFSLAMEELVMHRGLDLPLPDLPLPPDVTLRNWEPDLSNQFFEAYQASFRERPGFPGWSATEWIGGSFDDDDFRPEWSLLASADEVPVGFINAFAGNPGGFVGQMGVIPGHRRSGLGSALLVEAMDRMRDAGENEVQLTVNVNNPGAIKAYQQLEFKTVGRRASYEQVVNANSLHGFDACQQATLTTR